MLPSTVARVSLQTADSVNRQIHRRTLQNIARYQTTHPAQIQVRLDELDREWDIERTLEANAATAVMAGVTLGAIIDKRWYLLPGLVGGFLLLHALQGWCPPLPIFRRLGVRTASEIDYERYALKAIRGDFESVANHQDTRTRVQNALFAVEA